MLQENVEIVRQVVRSDDPGPFLELLDEEVELDTTGYPLADS